MVLLENEKGIEVVEYGEDTAMVNLTDDRDLYIGMMVQADVEISGLIYYASSLQACSPINIPHSIRINMHVFDKLFHEGTALYDLRTKDEYMIGHIPGANHVSTYKDEEKQFVMYCFDRFCDKKSDSSQKIIDSSHNKLFFEGGIRSWIQEKRPLEATIEHLGNLEKNNIPYILIDIRDPERVQSGHIPGAVSITSNIIELTRYRFPVYLKAFIFVYGSDSHDKRTYKAASVIAEWGFKNVMILQGGFENYKTMGFAIARNTVNEEIDYTRKYADREESLEVFRQHVKSLPEDTIILDVRESEEAEKGKFKNSMNIPLTELQYRLDEIDKQKHVITHCASGQRATIAYYILNKAGFNTSCLNAYVGFDDLGLYSISDN